MVRFAGPYNVGLNRQNLLAILSIVFLTWINTRGLRMAKSSKTFSPSPSRLAGRTGARFLVFDLHRAQINFTDFWRNAGLSVMHPYPPDHPAWIIGTISLVAVAMVGALFSADAWNNITFTAAEVKNPSRNLPLSLAFGAGTVIILYTLANIAYLRVLPISGDPHGATALARGIEFASDGEHTGVRLAYETDVDIDQHPGILAGARAVISLGHDEYYSLAMRNALLTARNVGMNLAFLGANSIYRHIRFADNDRIIICYKVAAIDPLYGKDDAETTQQWRDPPDPRPESVITGVFYECNPVSAPWVVYDPSSWIFAGTGAYKGERFPGMVGPEYDRLNPAVPFPRPMQVLAHSPLTCDGFSTYSDSVYYTVASGAGVFASGTMRWVCAMRGPSCGHGLTRAAERFVDRATQNLLRAFAAGPAGRTHPAQDNVAQVKPPNIPALYNGVD